MPKVSVPTISQVSAGGIAFRKTGVATEIALIRTAEEGRWQLPKGMIDPGETPQQAALREVREEAGINCKLLNSIEIIEYWFYGNYDGTRKRYHKKVHFFLMQYLDGDVADHDHEVVEARWVGIDAAEEMLAFKSEKELVAKARTLI